MELPILIKFDSTFMSLSNQNHEERIRILDIDGVYLVSLIVYEKYTNVMTKIFEIAFDSLYEAQEYLRDDHCIELDEEKDTKEWRHYDIE
jgi:hypothetical protein